MASPSSAFASAGESAARTYLRAGVFLLPALTVWMFTYIYLLTRLQMIWETLGVTHPRLRWLITASDSFMNYGRPILALLALTIFLLERYSRAWPRLRRGAVSGLVFVINAFVLLALAALLTSTLEVYSRYLSRSE